MNQLLLCFMRVKIIRRLKVDIKVELYNNIYLLFKNFVKLLFTSH